MSKTKMRNAVYSIHQLVRKTSGHSEKTKADTRSILEKCVKDLHSMGYKLGHIQGLKQKHILALTSHWKNNKLSPGTIKNNMSKLRSACKAMNKNQTINSNSFYKIEKRSYISDKNKAIEKIDLSKIGDSYIKLSMQSQQFFGLRREESIKIIYNKADKGDHLYLKGSWTKGGVSRIIPIITNEQRDFINQVKSMVGDKSLIPINKNNKNQINRYIGEARSAGFKNLHGLRHAYAQNRYEQITKQLSNGKGWLCPFQGGKLRKEMSIEERKIDYQARIEVSEELGHSRIAITKIYLG